MSIFHNESKLHSEEEKTTEISNSTNTTVSYEIQDYSKYLNLKKKNLEKLGGHVFEIDEVYSVEKYSKIKKNINLFKIFKLRKVQQVVYWRFEIIMLKKMIKIDISL